MEVTSILADIKLDKESIITGLLHDTLEDTLATKEEIVDMFGPEVYTLVEGVTKIGQIRISSTFERQAENFRKLILATGKDIRVILVKLADRLHNVRTISFLPEHKQEFLAKETLDLYAPLADRLGIYWIRTELEDRCFESLKPNEYKEITRTFITKKEEWEKYSLEIQNMLLAQLKKFEIDAQIQTRFKNFYGIYKKMMRRELDFNNVLDVKAFRVITKDVSSCYAALGAVHSVWKPVPGRFKDYIALPKSNGYKSLHTVIVGPFGDQVEVQIRSNKMHEVAEYGVAAHWKYKLEQDSSGKLIDLPDSVKKIFDAETLSDPKEFIDAVKDELITEFVYVFTPKGDLKELPAHSSIIDFAYSIHSDLGNQCSGARVNGRIVPLSYQLKSGDMIEIITKKDRQPSRDWLKYAVTSKAKTRIRNSIKKALSVESLKMGKDILGKKLSQHGLNINKQDVVDKLKKFAAEKSIKSLDDLFVRYSLSKINIVEILKYFNLNVQNKSVLDRESKILDSNEAIIVGGNDNIMVRFCKSCSPIYGDEIIGYITIGRGISIHRISCKQILEVDSSRLIEAKWDQTYRSKSPTILKVTCFDKPGILSEISNTIAKHDSNIIKINAKPISLTRSSIYIEMLVQDTNHLSNIINDLNLLPDINNVDRLMHTKHNQYDFNLY
jgi:GTP pyrophosphokinase